MRIRKRLDRNLLDVLPRFGHITVAASELVVVRRSNKLVEAGPITKEIYGEGHITYQLRAEARPLLRGF